MYLLLTDLSGKNDPWCTVGSKARRSSLSWLLMSLLSSNLYGFLCFSPLFSQSVLLVFFFHLTCLLSVCNTLQKNVFQLKMSCWPALFFLLFAVPYNYTGSVSRQIEGASFVSVTVRSADRSMGITVNTLSCFCWVLECLLLMDTPIGCFPLCQIKALHCLGTACRSQAV